MFLFPEDHGNTSIMFILHWTNDHGLVREVKSPTDLWMRVRTFDILYICGHIPGHLSACWATNIPRLDLGVPMIFPRNVVRTCPHGFQTTHPLLSSENTQKVRPWIRSFVKFFGEENPEPCCFRSKLVRFLLVFGHLVMA